MRVLVRAVENRSQKTTEISLLTRPGFGLGYFAGFLGFLVLYSVFGPAPALGTTWNVKTNCNASGNGTKDDAPAINTCIGNLQPGDTLLFPQGTYLIKSSLTIDVANVTVDGSSNTATILADTTLTGSMVRFGNPSGFCVACSLGPSVSLAFTAGELFPGFITSSSLGVNPGDYVYISQGGQDYSTDTCAVTGQNPPCNGHPTNCDVSGCRGEVLQVQSVSGNTILVSTALHDTYDLSLNAAMAQRVQNPLSGVTLQNITLDGDWAAGTPLSFYGVVNSTVSGVTIKNANDPIGSGSYSLFANVTYGLNLNNVTLTCLTTTCSTNSAVAQMGVYQHGNLSINTMSISGASGGAAYFSSGADDSVVSLTVNDASGGFGRPFKTTAVRYSTFNSLTVENGNMCGGVACNSSDDWNGISLEYYSSWNDFNNCTVTNNYASSGSGAAGVTLFGNYNQHNTFSNCTVSGNGNIQFYVSGSDALGLARDLFNTVSGGSFTGASNGQSAMYIVGGGALVTGATFNGPVGSGWPGIYLAAPYATYACLNNNTFAAGAFPSGAIGNGNANPPPYHDRGSGNNLNNQGSSLVSGACP